MAKITFLIAILLALLLSACAAQAPAAPILPTNTPMPTFTPTPEVVVTPVDPVAAAPVVTLEAEATAVADPELPPVAEQPQNGEQTDETEQPPAAPEQPVEPATPEPTATPTPPSDPAVVVGQNMNVRGGPGTNYAIIGAATAGQRFVVTGRNTQGDWWQINYNGRPGWVYGPLVTAQNIDSVTIAANIPAPPPPTNTPVPAQPTPVPPPAEPAPEEPAPEEPAPAPPPASNYKFNIAVVGRCDPNPGVTYVQGRTYVNGQPQSGDWLVAFSYAPDGPIVARIKAGPHPGYEGWDQGFYSHILQHDGPREGSWWFWVVDPAGNRISDMANVRTDGEAGDGKCQQAVVDFDSR